LFKQEYIWSFLPLGNTKYFSMVYITQPAVEGLLPGPQLPGLQCNLNQLHATPLPTQLNLTQLNHNLKMGKQLLLAHISHGKKSIH